MQNCSEDSSTRSGAFSGVVKGSLEQRLSRQLSEGTAMDSAEEGTGDKESGGLRGSGLNEWEAVKTVEQEALHEPAALLLWAETTDHNGGSKTTSSATAQRLFHGTFVRTLTVFADFWVGGPFCMPFAAAG